MAGAYFFFAGVYGESQPECSAWLGELAVFFSEALGDAVANYAEAFSGALARWCDLLEGVLLTAPPWRVEFESEHIACCGVKVCFEEVCCLPGVAEGFKVILESLTIIAGVVADAKDGVVKDIVAF